MKTSFLLSLILLLQIPSVLSQTVELYSTDFSEFPVGENELAGQHGWGSTVLDKGLHGIDSEIFPDSGNSAFLGFNVPEEEFTSVWKLLDYDPIAEGTPLFHFSADIAIIDSENENYDNFYISIWNTNIHFLASINFNNQSQTIWRQSDPGDFIELDHSFVASRIYRLEFTVDFEDNLWSATLSNEELFTDVPFHTGSRTLDIESVDFEWQVTDLDTPGDNWMFFDNIEISASPKTPGPVEPLVIESFFLNDEGQPTVSWLGQRSVQYQVQFSTDLTDWSNSLPGSTFTGPADGSLLNFADETADLHTNRYYRVIIVDDE